MASHGGSHEQQANADQQGHKSGTKQVSSQTKQAGGARKGSHEQHVKAGMQSRKNS